MSLRPFHAVVDQHFCHRSKLMARSYGLGHHNRSMLATSEEELLTAAVGSFEVFFEAESG